MFITELIYTTRQKIITQVESMSLEQLNKIPDGFNNNIAWNFGHIALTGYALSYVRTGVKPDYNIPYFDKFKLGSAPTDEVNNEELEQLKSLCLNFSSQVEIDIQNKIFDDMVPFSTSTFGTQMNNIEEVLTCIFGHDAMHLGTINALRKLV